MNRRELEERRREAISEVARDLRTGPLGQALQLTQTQAEERVRAARLDDLKRKKEQP